MTAKALHLTITTPMDVLVDEPAAQSVRAEDESGGFGLLPGHTDFLTALPASVVRWRGGDGAAHYCALRAGMLTMSGGGRVAIACREGILGDDLDALEADVAVRRAEETDADRRARVEQMRLHANAVRHLMHLLRPGAASMSGAFAPPPSPKGGGGAP